MSITHDNYKTLDQAYGFFNVFLFNKELPDCLITLQRSANSKGYYCHGRFASRADKSQVDEIAMNPDTFENRSDVDILSTLAHEMCHLWQQHLGPKPPKGRYHDKIWGTQMIAIGLIPSNTGEPGGKRTGQSMTHYIQPGGKFETICQNFLGKKSAMLFNSAPLSTAAAKSNNSKIKYTCPTCDANAWGKPALNILCGDCEETMTPEE